MAAMTSHENLVLGAYDVDENVTSKYNFALLIASFSRLLHLVRVVQCGRNILTIDWFERFHRSKIRE